MVQDVCAAARRPAFLLPPTDKWLARMFDRLSQIGTEDAAIQAAGETLTLVGHRLLALRELDDDLGRRVGRILSSNSKLTGGACGSLKKLATDAALTGRPKALREITEMAALLETERGALSAWPIGFRGLSFDKVTP
jgi:hypothetical protein